MAGLPNSARATGIFYNTNRVFFMVIRLLRKGQISTEYIVIFAVVIVVSLSMIYLVGGFSGLVGGSLEAQSRGYWNASSPFAIKAFNASNTSLTLEIENRGPDTLVLRGISIGGAPVYSGTLSFMGGQTNLVIGTLESPCGAAGAPYAFDNVIIRYNNGSFMGLEQAGGQALAGKCT